MNWIEIILFYMLSFFIKNSLFIFILNVVIESFKSANKILLFIVLSLFDAMFFPILKLLVKSHKPQGFNPYHSLKVVMWAHFDSWCHPKRAHLLVDTNIKEWYQTSCTLVLLYVHRKRDNFSLSRYFRSHQGITPLSLI